MTQPAPTPGTGDAWLDLLAALPVSGRLRDACLARRELGIQRYGTPLQRDNGRDHDADLLEELLDGAVYAWAERRWGVAIGLLVVAWGILTFSRSLRAR